MLRLGSLDRTTLQALRLKLEKEGNSPKEHYPSAPSVTLPVSIRGKSEGEKQRAGSCSISHAHVVCRPPGMPASEGYQQL